VPTGFAVINTNTTTPTVTWTAGAIGTKYAIWFVNLDTNTLVAAPVDLTTASYTTPPLTNARYRLFVRAYNSLGGTDWSNPFDFDVVV
jgi:hypothetical protein